MTEEEIRDRCCWKRCRAESDIVYLGIGLCDEHMSQAFAVFKNTVEYLNPRVIPQAARTLARTQKQNARPEST